MAGVRCSACGQPGHTLRDCKMDRSAVARSKQSAGPSALVDADYGAFLDELARRSAS